MATNPLDAFKKLKPWQQGAVVVGGVAVVGGVFLFERKQKAAATSTPAVSTPAAAVSSAVGAATGSTVTDPITGQVYPADEIDPLTQMSYAQEISEFGSVESAEESADSGGAAAEEEGLTPTEFDQETGETGQSDVTPQSNTTWVANAESAGQELGFSSSDVGQALSAYLAGTALGTTTDGVSEQQVINAILGEIGPPPTGSFAVIPGPKLPTAGGGGTNLVTVPNEIGRTDLNTAETAIKLAGLVPLPAGDSGVGNHGQITSQSPVAGSKVSRGSSVTLVYTRTSGSAPAPAPASTKLTVPDQVGRTDLDTALSDITKAGLKANATPASKKAAIGNKGKVTSQTPKAGSKVAKGTTVTLTYTK